MGIAAVESSMHYDTKWYYLVRNLLIVFSVFTVVACSNENFSDLKREINRIKAEPPGRIEPIPEFKTYETFAYSASDLRDPFRIFEDEVDVVEAQTELKSSGPVPDRNRNKETLEEYPLDTLRYVGQLEKGNQMWAIITSPDDLVHRVKVGNYLGQNYGHITAISEEKLEISELVTDGMGGWIEREAALSLGE